MKILFIFTGGTIGSTRKNDGYISTDSNKSYILLDKYREVYGIDFEMDLCEPYRILSENASGIQIRTLLTVLEETLSKDKKEIDGVIVTHGTDTLKYSASAAALLFRDSFVPVFFVSSNHTLEETSANGIANLHGAISCIRKGEKKGVWISYQNPGEETQILDPLYTVGPEAYSDALYDLRDFEPEKGMRKRHFSLPGSLMTDAEIAGRRKEIIADLDENCENVLMLTSYPGRVYPDIPKNTRYIIHGTYHSGTINTASEEALLFFREAKSRHIPVFLSGCTEGIGYESTSVFDDLGLLPAVDISPQALYMLLWLGLWTKEQ